MRCKGKNVWSIKQIIVEGNIITDENSIDCKFINFFSSVANDPENLIPQPTVPLSNYFRTLISSSFFVCSLTIIECISIICQLNNEKYDSNSLYTQTVQKYFS